MTLLVASVFVIDVLTGGGLRTLVRNGAVYVWSGVAAHSLFEGNIFSNRALESENEILRAELTSLRLQAAGFEILKVENASLRETLRVVEGTPGVAARIASSLRASPYGTFLVDAGSADGVARGQLVVIGDARFGGFAIGRIDDAGNDQSLVRSLFAPGEQVDAVVRGVGITITGWGGGQGRADIARDASVEIGDIVMSPHAGGRAVGIVGNIERDAGNAFQRLYIHLPVSFTDLSFVYIVQL